MKLHEWRVRLMNDIWVRHPGVRSDDQLSFGERSADRLGNGIGRAWQ